MAMFQKTGAARVNAVLASFQKIVDELDAGVFEIDNAVVDNIAKIEALKAETAGLQKTRTKAADLAFKLSELIQ